MAEFVGDYFITPHAVCRFQARVANVDAAIVHRVLADLLARPWRSSPGREPGTCVAHIRYNGIRFRAVIAEAPHPGWLPKVVTVL